MKTLRLLLAAVLSLGFLGSAGTAQAATSLKLVGALNWEIFEPNTTFTLTGGIQNVGTGTSGTLKIVLWATAKPFPSTGYPVAEYNMGTIPSGFQAADFKVRTPSKIPVLTGPYYFTISILEFTGTSWATRLIVPGSAIKNLTIGDFNDQPKWKLPKAKVIAPPKKLKYGDVINLLPKATGDLFPLPFAYQTPVKVTIRVKDKVDILSTEKERGTYKYDIKKGPFNKKRVSFSNIPLVYKGEIGVWSATKGGLSLYFQSPTSGTYKSTEIDKYGKFVTYGTFTFAD